MTTPLTALSPLDGRYAKDVEPLRSCLSEYALIRERVNVEVRYFLALALESGIEELPELSEEQHSQLLKIVEEFDEGEARKVREIEKTTKHDVKAVEYYVKERMKRIPGLEQHLEFIHFALTSEDVTNLAYGVMIQNALKNVLLPALGELREDLSRLADDWERIPMLGMTHGQPATPTTVGKELRVFVERLRAQSVTLEFFQMQGKFGGAVGNFAAHTAAYPDVRWEDFGREFVRSFGLRPLACTTQINPHDDIAELSHALARVNAILLDLSVDMWLYISRGVFRQKVKEGEIGSSTMPHKVNPIDFENAEGNCKVSSALLGMFAAELPRSRMQRDLSDSTVQRNIGVAFGHHLLALKAVCRGLRKLMLDEETLRKELLDHPEVFAETVQILLRKHGVQGGYEKLKEFTRGKKVTREDLRGFVQDLEIPQDEKDRVLSNL